MEPGTIRILAAALQDVEQVLLVGDSAEDRAAEQSIARMAEWNANYLAGVGRTGPADDGAIHRLDLWWVDELESLCEQAPGGNWWYTEYDEGVMTHYLYDGHDSGMPVGSAFDRNTAYLTVAMRRALPGLIAAVRALEEISTMDGRAGDVARGVLARWWSS